MTHAREALRLARFLAGAIGFNWIPRLRLVSIDGGGGLLLLQPPDRRWIDAECPCDVDQCFAIGEAVDRLLRRVLRHLSRPAEPHPTGLRALPAVIGSCLYQMALERGETGKDRHQ